MIFGKNYADLWFKDAAEGRVFYCFGRLGRGFIVDAMTERSLKLFIRRWTWWASAIFIIYILAGPMISEGLTLLYLLGSSIVLIFVYFHAVQRRVAGCRRTSTRITTDDIIQGRARVYSTSRVCALLICGVLMVCGSAVAF